MDGMAIVSVGSVVVNIAGDTFGLLSSNNALSLESNSAIRTPLDY